MGRTSKSVAAALLARMEAESRARAGALQIGARKPSPKTAHAREYQRLNTYPYSPEFYAFTCGALTRKGTPCKLRGVYENGRCRLHGGLSTGPKSEAGKRQSAKNGRKGGRPRKGQLET
jgi:hypothetical protein